MRTTNMAGKKLPLPAYGERRGYTVYLGVVSASTANAFGAKHRGRYIYVQCACPECSKLPAPQIYAVRLERWLAGKIQTACKSLQKSKYKAYVRRRLDSLTLAQKVSIFRMAKCAEFQGSGGFARLAERFKIAGNVRTKATVIAGVLAIFGEEIKGMAKTMKEYRFLFARLRELRASNRRPDMSNKTHSDAIATARALINKYGHLSNVGDWIKRDLELAQWAVEHTDNPAETTAADKPTPSVEIETLPPINLTPSAPWLEKHGLIDSKGRSTDRGRAWNKKVRESLKAEPGNNTQRQPVKAPEPVKGIDPTPAVTNKLLKDIPYYQTEAAFYATQEYFNEFHQMPPEELDLKAWIQQRQAAYQQSGLAN
jgi:hypothetical protein